MSTSDDDLKSALARIEALERRVKALESRDLFGEGLRTVATQLGVPVRSPQMISPPANRPPPVTADEARDRSIREVAGDAQYAFAPNGPPKAG
jgi:hypothetical protein